MPVALSRILACLVLLLPGCAQFPELDATITEEARQAPNPVLMDNDVVLGPAAEALLDEETTAELLKRAAELEARAQAANGPLLISPQERADLLKRAAALRAEAARVAQQG